MATAISGIYWTLICFAPALILPPAAQSTPGSVEPSSAEAAKPDLAFVSLDIDLALHAAPALSLLADFFLLERRFSASQVRKQATLLSVIVGVWYGWWVEHCAVYNKTCTFILNSVAMIRTYDHTIPYSPISILERPLPEPGHYICIGDTVCLWNVRLAQYVASWKTSNVRCSSRTKSRISSEE